MGRSSPPRLPFWPDALPARRTVRALLNRDRGPASDHACVDCGGRAAFWAYDHQDPAELYETPDRGRGDWGRVVPYSANLAHYQPLCLSCRGRRAWAGPPPDQAPTTRLTRTETRTPR